MTLFSAATITTTGGDTDSIDTITVALTNHTATQTLALSSGAATAASTNGITVSFNAAPVFTLTGNSGGGGSNENRLRSGRSILRGVTFNDTSNNPVNPTTVTVAATNTAGVADLGVRHPEHDRHAGERQSGCVECDGQCGRKWGGDH